MNNDEIQSLHDEYNSRKWFVFSLGYLLGVGSAFMFLTLTDLILRI